MDKYLQSFSHFPNEYDIEGVQIMAVEGVQQWLWFTNTDTTKEKDQIQQKKMIRFNKRNLNATSLGVDSETQARWFRNGA